MKKKFICFIFMAVIMVCIFNININAYSDDNAYSDNVVCQYGTAGSINGEERNPEQDDHSNWLTIHAGDYGVRIVAQDGRELIAVDNYGGIYLNGDLYLNRNLLKPEIFNIANGMFYLLLVISIVLNIYCVVKVRKRR